jgi:hypothetical protein
MNALFVFLWSHFQSRHKESSSTWLHTFSSTHQLIEVTSHVDYVFGHLPSASIISRGGRVRELVNKLIPQNPYALTRFHLRVLLLLYQPLPARHQMFPSVALSVPQPHHVYGDTTFHTTCDQSIWPSHYHPTSPFGR